MSDSTPTPTITKSDAKDLKALTNSEFKVLAVELNHRFETMKDGLKSQQAEEIHGIEVSYAEQVEGTRQALIGVMDKYRDKIQKVIDKVDEDVRKIYRDKGCLFREQGHNYQKRYNLNPENPVPFFYVSQNDQVYRLPGKTEMEQQQEACNIKYRRMMDKLNEDYRMTCIKMDRKQQDFVRSLLLQSISGEAARSYLGALPTVENLLPAPMDAVDAAVEE